MSERQESGGRLGTYWPYSPWGALPAPQAAGRRCGGSTGQSSGHGCWGGSGTVSRAGHPAWSLGLRSLRPSYSSSLRSWWGKKRKKNYWSPECYSCTDLRTHRRCPRCQGDIFFREKAKQFIAVRGQTGGGGVGRRTTVVGCFGYKHPDQERRTMGPFK